MKKIMTIFLGPFLTAYFIKVSSESIVILKEKVVDNLWLISVLYGISQSAYWFPYNLFVIDKVENSERTSYTVKKRLIVSSIGVLVPTILGTTITITNFELTSIIILVISLVQIILSFMLTPDKHVSKLKKYK